jgi:hypothetical protein
MGVPPVTLIFPEEGSTGLVPGPVEVSTVSPVTVPPVPVADIVRAPPRLSDVVERVIPLPAVNVIALDETAPAVTVNSVPLKLAAPRVVVVAALIETTTAPVVGDATMGNVPVTEETPVTDDCHEGGAPELAVRTCPAVPLASHEGTPELLVMSTPLSAVANADITFAEEAYSRVFTAFVVG